MQKRVLLEIVDGPLKGKKFEFTDDVVPTRERDESVPTALADVLDKALAEEVKERYQTAAEMLEALEQAL